MKNIITKFSKLSFPRLSMSLETKIILLAFLFMIPYLADAQISIGDGTTDIKTVLSTYRNLLIIINTILGIIFLGGSCYQGIQYFMSSSDQSGREVRNYVIKLFVTCLIIGGTVSVVVLFLS